MTMEQTRPKGGLDKRIGPLPLWAWIVAGGGAVFVIFILPQLARRGGSSQAQQPFSPTAGIPFGAGSGGAGGTNFGAGAGGVPGLLDQIFKKVDESNSLDKEFFESFKSGIDSINKSIEGSATKNQLGFDVLSSIIKQTSADTQGAIAEEGKHTRAQLTDMTGILTQGFKDLFGQATQHQLETNSFFGQMFNQSASETDRIVTAILSGTDPLNPVAVTSTGNVGV